MQTFYTINVNDYSILRDNLKKIIRWGRFKDRLITLDDYAMVYNQHLNPYGAWINSNDVDIINFKSSEDRTFFILKFS